LPNTLHSVSPSDPKLLAVVIRATTCGPVYQVVPISEMLSGRKKNAPVIAEAEPEYSLGERIRKCCVFCSENRTNRDEALRAYFGAFTE
jgi:hypothetical protein